MTEERLVGLITEEIKKSDIIDVIKKDSNFEKRVREIVSDVVVDMYRVLWQHNSLFKSLGVK